MTQSKIIELNKKIVQLEIELDCENDYLAKCPWNEQAETRQEIYSLEREIQKLYNELKTLKQS